MLWTPGGRASLQPCPPAGVHMVLMRGRRLQTRVRAAKEQQATTGRFQGGRPPYGYRLVPTGQPHPNSEKARWGVELQRLDVDPGTAPWVQQISPGGYKGPVTEPSPHGSTTSAYHARAPMTGPATVTGPGGRGVGAPSAPSSATPAKKVTTPTAGTEKSSGSTTAPTPRPASSRSSYRPTRKHGWLS